MAIYESNKITAANLLAGPEVPVLTKNYPVTAGKALAKGTLLTIGEDGKAAATVKGGVASAVVANDADAKATVVTAYVAGRFNRETVIADSSDTVAAHEEELRKVGIHLTSSK